jgi:hypothetical protein
MFKNARLINAGNMLVEQGECGRLWNALFDLQVSASDRVSKEITHGIQEDTTVDFGSSYTVLRYQTVSICTFT